MPGNELDKVVIDGNANSSIEGGGVGVTVKVAGDNLVLGVAQDGLEGAL